MTVLCLSPHTDDSELGCGATLSRFQEEGCEVYYAAFSYCNSPVLINEVNLACKEIGIKPPIVFNHPVREFDKHRQIILDEMISLRRIIKPDLVFLPSRHDIHQDHSVIFNEGVRCFKYSSIFAYEMPWNNLTFSTNCFLKVEQRHIDKKIKALMKYESQKHRPYINANFIESLARVRGTQAGSQYAEAFEIIRHIK